MKSVFFIDSSIPEWAYDRLSQSQRVVTRYLGVTICRSAVDCKEFSCSWRILTLKFRGEGLLGLRTRDLVILALAENLVK
jgi:hypothetical protein